MRLRNSCSNPTCTTPEIYISLALAYAGKGDTASAQEFFARVVEFNSLPSINYAFVRAKAQKMAAHQKPS